ncbi:hypothetical protein [Gordonia sp. CPCC 205333]|uniref:hypothetical protein n=1 Tax=Gordonia sp. CPCC 205333 TaxID=3140790 RepID=UPI003AF3C9FD
MPTPIKPEIPISIWLLTGATAVAVANPRVRQSLTPRSQTTSSGTGLLGNLLNFGRHDADLPVPQGIPRPFPPIPQEPRVVPANNPSIPDRIYTAEDAAKAYFALYKRPFSRKLYDHFLGNTGTDYVYTEQEALQVAKATDGTTQAQLATAAQQAANNAKNDPSLYGKPQYINSSWQDVYQTEDGDITTALGHYWTSVTTTVVVTKTANPDVVHYEMKYQVHFWDYYDFDMDYHNWLAQLKDGDMVTWLKMNVDIEMQWLRKAGFAKYFQNYGSTPPMSKSGGWSDSV